VVTIFPHLELQDEIVHALFFILLLANILVPYIYSHEALFAAREVERITVSRIHSREDSYSASGYVEAAHDAR
jgi:hypothetical protein